MTITNKQLEAFEKYRTDEFIDKVILYLKKNFKEEMSALKEEEIRQLVSLGLRNAKKYHIDREIHVVRYITLMIRYGRDFDQEEWVADILAHPRGDAEWILDKIENSVQKVLKK